MKHMKIGARLALLMAVMVILTVVVGIAGIQGMAGINAGLETVYENRTVPLVDLSQLLDSLHRIRTRVVGAVGAADAADRDRNIQEIAGFEADVDRLWGKFMATPRSPEERELAGKIKAAISAYREAKELTITLLRSGDSEKARENMARNAGPKFDQVLAALRDLLRLQESLASQEHEKAKDTYGDTRNATWVLAMVGLLIAGGIAVMIVRSITGSIAEMIGVMTRLADGDTSVEVGGLDRRDEIGAMARTVAVFKDNAIARERLEAEQEEQKRRSEEEKRRAMQQLADGFEGTVRSVVQAVASAAGQMQANAQGMSASSDQTSRQAMSVAAAAEQATVNVQTVAAATEELSGSVNEIGRQVVESTQIANQAVEEARRTNDTVAGLTEAAYRIGEVVQLINAIASQTNLLALNATIEAARAGEAGKGFAVVASEVKNLACQTAKATDDIQAQVAQMQTVTGTAADAIRHITGTIGRMSEIATAIASAVQEQGAATQEIARNVSEAASGTRQVSSHIAGVTQAAAENGTMASQVLDAAGGLSRQAEVLSREVDGFIARVRAA